MPDVRMKTLSAGPEGVVPIGKVVTVSDEEATELVGGGFADYEQVPADKPAPPNPADKPKATGKGKKG